MDLVRIEVPYILQNAANLQEEVNLLFNNDPDEVVD
jgi:hypothetical protein